MKNHKKVSEKTKNIIIILLILSAVFLGWESRLFGNTSVNFNVLGNLIGGNHENSGSGGQQSGVDKTSGEARPVSIAVTGSNGTHYGAKYDFNEIEQAYDKSVQSFKEALGSAQTPVPVSEEAWRAALLSSGVCFEYFSPIHLDILSDMYGNADSSFWGDISARRLCVASVDGKIRLYYQKDYSDQFYSAETAVAADGVLKLTEAFGEANAAYVFEKINTGDLSDPYALLFPEVKEYPVAVAANPLTDENKKTEVLQELGVSEHSNSIFPVEDGTVYIASEVTVRLMNDGTVSYKRTSDEETSPARVTESQAIEIARQAVAASIGKYCGAARVYFDGILPKGSGAYQIMFKYVFAGGQVYLGQDGYAAAVEIADGAVSEMELRFRTYTSSDETLKLFPEIQTAAATGGAFMLCYSDNGNTSLPPSWVAVSTLS